MRGFRKRWLSGRLKSPPPETDSLHGSEPGHDVSLTYSPDSPVPGSASNHDLIQVRTADVGGRSSYSDNELALQNAFVDRVKPCEAKLPWESDLMTQIFGSNDLVPSIQLGMASQSAVSVDNLASAQASPIVAPPADCFGDVTSRCIKNLKDTSFWDDRTETLSRATQKWLFILALNRDGSLVGQQLTDNVESNEEIMKSVFGTKSPNTVMKRANSFMSFYRWFLLHKDGLIFPISEAVVWDYMQSLCNSSAASTTLMTFIQCLRFCHYTFGMQGCMDVVASRRVIGKAEIQLSLKKSTRQARPLRVDEVQLLHTLSASAEVSLTDRVALSHILLMLYGRCRHSDVVAVESILHDMSPASGYVQLNTKFHKTARSAQAKSLLLPILIPCNGVGFPRWVDSWISCRKEAGLAIKGDVNGPLLPAFKESKGQLHWGARPVTCSEITLLLRAFLKCDDANLSSHSLKTTTLSWCSKAEVSREHRRILGRHASALKESDSIYARDLGYGPVRSLERVMTLIETKVFDPDATRSAFFPSGNPLAPGTPMLLTMQPLTPNPLAHVKPVAVPAAPEQPENEVIDVDVVKSEQLPSQDLTDEIIDVDSSSSSDSSSPSEIDGSTDEEIAIDRFSDDIEPVSEILVRNSKSHIVHACTDSFDVTKVDRSDPKCVLGAFTKCGHRCGEAFALVDGSPFWTTKCRICFRGRRQPW